MTKKEWLGQYGVLLCDIKRTEAEIQRWRARAENVTRLLSDMPKGSGGRSQLEDAVCAMDELEQELAGQILELIAVRKEIAAAIDGVRNPVYRELLKRRYIDGNKWEQIAVDMNYCYRHVVHVLHPKALAALNIS